MAKNISLVMVLLFLLVMPASAKSSDKWDFIEKMESGRVNWSKAVISARGIGEPAQKHNRKQGQARALKTAELDAKRKIFEIIPGIRIDATRVIGNFASKNDIMMAKLRTMVKEAKVVKQEYMSDGTVAVTIEMRLIGGFAQLVLPREIKQVETVRAVVSNNKTKKSRPFPPRTITKFYSGLVIDARGLKLKPALVPKILDENGQEVYGPAYVSREYAVQKGMSAYTRGLKAAKINPRVADNPLVVKGLRTQGPAETDIVISNSDASRLRSASENLSFLKKCRVMIVAN